MVIAVPLGQLVEGDNVRRFYGDLDELARTIEATGHVQTVDGRRLESGKIELVTGYRRSRAVRRLFEAHRQARGGHACRCGGELCRWAVMPVELRQLTELEAMTVNAAENLERKDLTFVELCGAFDRFRRRGMTAREVGERLGFSASHVQNCLRVLDRACPELRERLEAGQDIPVQLLIRWATLEENEQREELSQWLKLKSSPRTGATIRSRGPTRTRLQMMLSIVRRRLEESEPITEMERSRLEGIAEGLEIAIGKRRAPRIP